MASLPYAGIPVLLFAGGAAGAPAAPPASWWDAPDRAAKVLALAPGHSVRVPAPEEFLRDWTRQQVERWTRAHPVADWDALSRDLAQQDPADATLTADLPADIHISPYGLLVSGTPDKATATGCFITYCPLCGHRRTDPFIGIADLDPKNYRHATTQCCKQDLWEREEDMPAGYKLRPNTTGKFTLLDGTVREVPGCRYTDTNGWVWDLFPGTVVAYLRWVKYTMSLTWAYNENYLKTGDPVHVHKLAVLLDRITGIYPNLPFTGGNEWAQGANGKPLTRAEWDAIRRPVREGDTTVFGRASGHSFYGKWNRSAPVCNRGWLLYPIREARWALTFSLIRQHPAFQACSKLRYGDPQALERRVRETLMTELALVMKAMPLATDSQYGHATELYCLGVLLRDPYLIEFGAGHAEAVIYAGHYADGMNAQGAPNYMALLTGIYDYLKSPTGWLIFHPEFLQDHPFFAVASTQLAELKTARGLPLEFGDQYVPAFPDKVLTKPEEVRPHEQRPSQNWPIWGLGVLRVGGPGHRQEVMLTYDRVSLHSASDKLGIECWVDGVPVLREGGYVPGFNAAVLDPARPEVQALLKMPYPKPIFEAGDRPTNEVNCWHWAHGHWAHNTFAVNETGTGAGWQEGDGFGELIAFKGGEETGQPGSRFQVLDARDRHSFARQGVPVSEARRTLLAVERPGGRPYVVDVVSIRGGQRHALFNSAWGEPADAHLPAVAGTAASYGAYIDQVRGQPLATAEGMPKRAGEHYAHLKPAEMLAPPTAPYDVTWRTDLAAYASCTADGTRLPRPLPDDVGRVRLRWFGLNANSDALTLVRAKGPWYGVANQPLPNGTKVSQYIGFHGAWDYLIEGRAGAAGAELASTYLHVLEGFREGEESVIRDVRLLPTPPAGTGWTPLVLQIAFADGDTDTVVLQRQAGQVQLPDLATDARYALLRRDREGQPYEAHLVGGSRLECGALRLRAEAEYAGDLVDLVGDLTGTRRETALIVRPRASWPTDGTLAGRALLVGTIADYDEAYTVERVSALADGNVRVDLAGHPPLTSGWYQVSTLGDRPNRVVSGVSLELGLFSPWWHGCRAWFPARNRSYALAGVEPNRVTVNFREPADCPADGVRPGDWFVIHALEPGRPVRVQGQLTWRR